MERTAACLAKLERMNRSLRHEEGDRVPVSDFFWGSFLQRWREETGVPPDTDIYRYYDLDWRVTIPNMDPKIRPFEVVNRSAEEIVVRTGFGAIIRKRYDQAMPAYECFETDSLDKLEKLQFDSPMDEKRYFRSGDNQIAGVGDGFERNSQAWLDTLHQWRSDFPVYGSVCECHEMLWRIIGPENVMCWMGEEPNRLAHCIDRIGEYCVGLTRGQILAADGRLDGMVIWGDVAYCKTLLFSPAYWRAHFKPWVREIVRVCHEAGLPVIYHGCGNARKIFEDFIEIGVDAYNPLEAKAGMDVVELRKQFGHRIAFCGNMDARAWAEAPFAELEDEVLRKLSAAEGGGYIFQSDHSVPGNVSAERYEFVLGLVRKHGNYPLKVAARAAT